MKCSSWEETLKKLCKLITMEYHRHLELETSDRLNPYEKELFFQIAKGKAGEIDYQMSLQFLSLLLHKHHGEKAIIIIDEYDTPIQQAYTCGYISLLM